jgi:hypothetical protein
VYTYLKADYNILQGIQHEIANLPIASSVEWAKGHQDRHKPRSELSIEALVNCIADDICTDTHPPSSPRRRTLPRLGPRNTSCPTSQRQIGVKETGLTEITQPCIHTCDGLFICQLYSLPDLLEETECKEDTPLTLPFVSFVSLSQLIIVI